MNNVSGRSTRYIIGVPPSKRGFTTLREDHVQRWLTSTRKTRTQGEPSFFCYFFAGSIFHTFSSQLSNFPSLSPSYVSYSTGLFFCHLCYQVLVIRQYNCRTTRRSIHRKSHKLRLFYFLYRSSCRELKTRTSIQSRIRTRTSIQLRDPRKFKIY